MKRLFTDKEIIIIASAFAVMGAILVWAFLVLNGG